MKSLTQILSAIVLSSFIASCNKTPEPPQLKNWTFIEKYEGIIQVDYLEYYKSIFDFEREIIANLHLRPQETTIPEDYPKVVMDIYYKGNQSVKTFIDYSYLQNPVVVDEYWDFNQEKFVKRNKDNEEEFKKLDQEYQQLLELINFKAKVARKIRD